MGERLQRILPRTALAVALGLGGVPLVAGCDSFNYPNPTSPSHTDTTVSTYTDKIALHEAIVTNDPEGYLQILGNNFLAIRQNLVTYPKNNFQTPPATTKDAFTSVSMIKTKPGFQETVTIDFSPKPNGTPQTIAAITI